ncbi:hypothetical protein PAERUG_P48_London_17_VIM_2_01_13_00578 [Pseudomonas aeruginosa]|nr:hypothetical protein PAERUG_P48_London_17_VIM_2_01_13_00578 [Pseudomonas aeruginosa]
MADHRLAHGAEGRRQLLDHFVLADAQAMVAGVIALGDQVGILELVAALAAGILEADGEGQQVVHPGFVQQAHQQARIDPAGEQHADLAGGALADRHRFAEAVEDALLPVVERQLALVRAWAVVQRPPGALLAAAVEVDAHPGRRRQLLHALQQGVRGGNHGVEVEVEIQRLRIEVAGDVAALEQGRQARGEAQARAVEAVVERLDAEAVTGQEQPLAITLPDGEGEHPIEPGQ